MKVEKWLPVVGYEGLYEVSDWGRVRSLKFNPSRYIGKSASSHGYLQVGLTKDGVLKMYRVHRLVLEAFVGPCPPGCESLHGPNGRADASLANLSWGTPKKNQLEDRARDHKTNRGEKCGSNKLSWEQIQEIRATPWNGETVTAIGARYGISPSTVSKIRLGRRWQYPPEAW